MRSTNGIMAWPKEAIKDVRTVKRPDGSEKQEYTGLKNILLSLLICAILGVAGGVGMGYLSGDLYVLITFAVLFSVGLWLGFCWLKSFGVSKYEYDKTTGDMVVKDRPSDDHFMKSEEEENIFERVDDVMKTTKKVIGKDDEEMLCSIDEKKLDFSNRNAAYIGYPGCGKSACEVTTHIYQTAREGKSMIITDSKGTLCYENYMFLKKKGYKIRILNLKPKEMKFSDGVEFMTTITDQMGAETMANIIMDNAAGGGEKHDFWYKCEFNLLKALILYVKFDKTIPEEEKTLIKVYMTLLENTVEELSEILGDIQNPLHPAFAAAQSFAKSADTVKESAYGGLAVKLALLAQPAVQHMLSNPEISFREPMREKCAYFVIISDTDTSARFLACLFFSTLINELMDEADKQHQNPAVAVQFILDEFKATGSIPNFDNILSVARSRKIDIEFIIQDITQLEAMYPEGWHTIMNDCAIWVLLGAREEKTLQYFAALAGERAVQSRSESYSTNADRLVERNSEKHVSEGQQSKKLYGVADLLHMSRKKIFVSIAGEQPIYLHKYMYWEHPYYKIIKEKELYYDPASHIPEWRKKLIAEGNDIDDEYHPNEAPGSAEAEDEDFDAGNDFDDSNVRSNHDADNETANDSSNVGSGKSNSKTGSEPWENGKGEKNKKDVEARKKQEAAKEAAWEKIKKMGG